MGNWIETKRAWHRLRVAWADLKVARLELKQARIGRQLFIATRELRNIQHKGPTS